jgi:hypothetical protein
MDTKWKCSFSWEKPLYKFSRSLEGKIRNLMKVGAFKYKDNVVLNSDLQRVSRKLIWKDSKFLFLFFDNGIARRGGNKGQHYLHRDILSSYSVRLLIGYLMIIFKVEMFHLNFKCIFLNYLVLRIIWFLILFKKDQILFLKVFFFVYN